MTQWYFKRDGQAVGPVSEQTIRELASTGSLGPGSSVRRDNGNWVSLQDLPELRGTVKSEDQKPDESKPVYLVRGPGDPVVGAIMWICIIGVPLAGLLLGIAWCWFWASGYLLVEAVSSAITGEYLKAVGYTTGLGVMVLTTLLVYKRAAKPDEKEKLKDYLEKYHPDSRHLK